ncbi:hypothetical protein [Candidatus Marimicrobium litorale]|uniref:Uncharacterized protein n=1 Tax=Candidatus Marimicrobium litorale TaxID=2518991 RepID=A0ABT3T8Q3_9GAMM|nr:hypothetical protein [Candidatus Marimicrobium litorale]MCX2978669.1 hypothetical protein [Candidatus Marimicrobium litorale]
METAQTLANEMTGFEQYTPYLAPFPARVLMGDEMTGYVLFAQGWHRKELEGRWSDGKSSKIYVKIPPGKHPSILYIHGRYHGEEEATRVIVNGNLLSEIPLIHHNIDLPPGIVKNGQLEIEFQHIAPITVRNDSTPGEGEGTRTYEFFLVRLSVY